MRVSVKLIVTIMLFLLLVLPVLGDDTYCSPLGNDITPSIVHEGNWFNITLTSPVCYVCTQNGGGFGDLDCTLCSEHLPIPSFTSNVTCGNVPVSVQFNDTSAGNPTSWYWDLGEGTNSTERNPLFIYNTTGVFSINHSATNEYGTSWINQTDYLRSIPSYDVCTAPGGTTGARYIVNGISGIWLYIILGLAAAFLAIYGVMDLRNRFYANIVSLFMSSLLTFYLSVTVGNGTLHYGILIDQIAGTTTPIILKDTSLGWLLIIPAVAAMIATSYLVYDAYSESKGNGEED